MKCHEYLMQIKSFLGKKQSGPGANNVFRELFSLMQSCLDWPRQKIPLIKFKNASV